MLSAPLVSTNSYSQTSCGSCSTNNCSSVTFSAIYNGSTIYSNKAIPWVAGMNVTVEMSNANSSGASLTYQSTQYCPYGSFVNTINGITAASGYYWALYVNGVFAQFGIDFQQLNANDNVVFVYSSINDIKNGTALKGKSLKKQSPSPIMAKSHQFLYFTSKENLKNKK